MARMLQREYGYNFPNSKNDEMMARNLQNEYGYNLPNT